MKKSEFLEFLVGQEIPPALLKAQTKVDILLSFRSRRIVSRFIFFELLGALFSLTICPQFGLGFLEGHGLAHAFRSLGELACAASCASLFLSSGLLLAFFGMPGEELWWVWRRFKLSLILIPPLLWGVLMLTNRSAGLPRESALFSLIWIGAGVLVQGLWLELRSQSFVKDLGTRTSAGPPNPETPVGRQT